MKHEQVRAAGILSLVLGCLSWLMLLDAPWWWVGLGAVLSALVMSWRVLRKPEGRTRRTALYGLLVAAAAAMVCIGILHTGPTAAL